MALLAFIFYLYRFHADAVQDAVLYGFTNILSAEGCYCLAEGGRRVTSLILASEKYSI